MDLQTIQRIRSSPAEFRKVLLIDRADGGVATLDACSDPWQREDDAACDNGLCIAAGVPTDPSKPSFSRAYLERARGHAKSSSLAAMMAWLLYASPRQIEAIGAAADQEQGGVLRNAVARLVGLNGWLGDALDVQQWRVVNRHTQSELRIIASDVASSYGLTPHAIVCDELSHWTKPDLWASLVSSAAKRRDCFLGVISNAGVSAGGTSWVWEAREAARLSDRWYFHSLPGSCASWIDAAALAEQKRLLPDAAYRRLWLNEWTSGEGDCLTESDIAAALVLPSPIREASRGWGYVAGVDLGLARDCSAVVVVGKNFYGDEAPEGTLRVCEVKAWKPRPGERVKVEAVEQFIADAHARFNLSSVAFDPWQSEYLSQRLTDAGLPCLQVPMVARNLQAMATSLTEAFSERVIQLFDDAALLADLRSLRVVEKQYGWRLDPVRNSDGHGDRGVALAIGLFAASSALAGPAIDPCAVGDMLRYHRSTRRRFRVL